MANYIVTVEIELTADSKEDAMNKIIDEIIKTDESISYGITHVLREV